MIIVKTSCEIERTKKVRVAFEQFLKWGTKKQNEFWLFVNNEELKKFLSKGNSPNTVEIVSNVFVTFSFTFASMSGYLKIRKVTSTAGEGSFGEVSPPTCYFLQLGMR